MFNNYIFRIFSILIVILLVAGCREKKNNIADTYTDVVPIIIDIKEAIQNKVDYKYSDILFDSITFIPLECFIDDFVLALDNSSIMRITPNFFFVQGKSGRTPLLCYDHNGKFIRKIAERGPGPGEFGRLRDVAVDEEKGIVYVLDRSDKKIYKYNFEGVFLEVINLSNHADKIAVNLAGQLLIHFPNWDGDLQYSCLLFDNKGDTINKLNNNIFYGLDAERTKFGYEGLRYIYNDRIHVKGKSDTLYVVENNRFIPKYIFSTGEKLSKKLSRVEYDEKISISYIHETDSKVFFHFGIDKTGYWSYYDKKTGKAFSARGAIINDMYDRKEINLSMFTYQYNDEIIMVRGSSFNMDKLKENVSPSKYLEISNMLDSVYKKDDDPVILSILHLKKQ